MIGANGGINDFIKEGPRICLLNGSKGSRRIESERCGGASLINATDAKMWGEADAIS